MLPSIEQRLATELSVKFSQIQATVQLLDDGATVPFIARYRKEATGGLDDAQLRQLAERLHSLRELEKRRAAIITAIEKLGKMTPPLLDALTHATDKAHLEDLYLPYRKKRRTKAQIALEAGLQPLADTLLNDPRFDPLVEAARYLKAPFTTEEGDNPGVSDVDAALEGAQHILIERFAEHAPLLQTLRDYLRMHGVLTAKAVKDKKDGDTKYTDYHDYSEAIGKIPSHRALALLRGEREGVLKLKLLLDSELEEKVRNLTLNPCEQQIARQFNIRDQKRAADGWLIDTVRTAWHGKIFSHLETELMSNLQEHAETEAIRVFAQNLKALLLASPAGTRVTIGLDPGLRTGVKVAVVGTTGKVLETATIYPHAPKNDWDGSLHTLQQLAERHQASLIAIGNGTASRETDQLAKELIKRYPQFQLTSIMVSEAGASVYSASELASKELPELDVSLRGAVSIARRLQDPLAELVKIDPKSIGVGQYQHDVNQNQLAQSLDAV
ncbi:MAG: RNA-binding transcriptional accessory protein, partial [Nitrosomonas sp.]|nr:RNA-binding transcriptional accessory protein [Nitrosomonas sp.]